MLNLTRVTRPSELIQMRAKGLRARKYDAGKNTISFRVGPIGGRFEDLVLFDVKRAVAVCSRLKDGSRCESNKFGGWCCHVWAASKELQMIASRKVAA